jgi:hypothetical protein
MLKKKKHNKIFKNKLPEAWEEVDDIEKTYIGIEERVAGNL